MPSDPPPPGGPPPPPPPPSPDGDRGGAPDFTTLRRLHPTSVVLGIPLSQVVQGLIFPLFAGFAAGGIVTLYILTVVGVISLVFRFLDWQRRQFSFDGEVLRVDSGVLSRSHRSLHVDRIQQVEIQRGPVQRLLGLAALRVETAGSASEPEVDLRVLPEPDALALRAAVRVSKARATGRDLSTEGNGAHDLDGPDGRTVLTVPAKHIALASVTGARLLVLPAIIGASLQFVGQQAGQFTDWIERRVRQLDITELNGSPLEGPDWWLIGLSALVIAILAIAFAIGVGLVRDGRFHIERIDDDLHVSRGLLTTRESVVPLRRVQFVMIQRNWLRRLLGFAAVQIRSAGGSAGGDGRVTVPLIPGGAIDQLLREILPGVDGVPELTPHPKQAMRRALFRWLRPAAYVIALLWVVPELFSFFAHPIVTRVAWASLLLIPINATLAIVEYRHLAHALTDVAVVSRRGALSISTTFAPVVKVQAVTARANVFQRRLKLTSIVVHIAGPGALVEIVDAAADDAVSLHARLTRHAAAPTSAAAALIASGSGEPQSA